MTTASDFSGFHRYFVELHGTTMNHPGGIVLSTHPVKLVQAVLDITLSVFVPCCVMLLYALSALFLVTNGFCARLLEVLVAFTALVVWCWAMSSSACVVDSASAVVLHDVTFGIQKLAGVIRNTLETLMHGGVVSQRTVLVGVSDTSRTSSNRVSWWVSVTLLFDLCSALAHVAMSFVKMCDIVTHAIETFNSLLGFAVFLQLVVAVSALVAGVGPVAMSTSLSEVVHAFGFAEVASLLHEVSCVLLEALITFSSLAKFIGTQSYKVRSALCAVGLGGFWCFTY